MNDVMKPVLIGSLAALFVILFLPWFFKDRKRKRLDGPDLSGLEYTEISFDSGELKLAGMLFLPGGQGPFPAVVVIHGSGTSARNSPWYLAVTEYLQANGIAVLLPDKRGSERSGGDWKQASMHDFAGDASAAIGFLRVQKMFACSAIGVLGLSQGGWVVPIVAVEEEEVAFAISMSGAAVTVEEQILYQTMTDIADWGTYRFVARMIAPLVAKSIMKKDYCRMLVGFDPLPYWKRVAVPAFMAFGEDDQAVPVKDSLERIRLLGNAHIRVKTYPGMGHGLAEPTVPGIYRVSNAFLGDLVDFIKNV